ncbi:MAG: CopG family antitoxin [Candidatus Sumerlaeota bacterium]|nr:CopG family antitoxin [Candidatus Sumerlaeota bacterium]
MAARKRKTEEIPETFASYEEAGEFWDTHDSADYLEHMTPVEVDARLRERRFEIEIDADVVAALRKRANSRHVPASRLANDLLRKQLLVG